MSKKFLRTVGSIRDELKHLPSDMLVEFSPITSAWLGTMGPLRIANELNFYEGGKVAVPFNPAAKCVIYLYEDKEDST